MVISGTRQRTGASAAQCRDLYRRLADGQGAVAAVMRELRDLSPDFGELSRAVPAVEEHEGEEPREGADGSCSGANLSKEEVGS